ncbi:hypothetical protein SSTU70S_01394 [Stutzerimonas stutzeri]
MRDGAAERRLPGLLRVDMNELVIAGALGEVIDAALVDGRQPVGVAEFLADVVLEFIERYLGHGAVPLRDVCCR